MSLSQIRKIDLVLLHIGLPKTGTTTIQKFLRANREELHNQKLGLLEKFGAPNNVDFVAYFARNSGKWAKQKGIENDLEKYRYFLSFGRDFRTDLDAAIGSAKLAGGALLITSENFSGFLRSENELQTLHDFLTKYAKKIKVVCYVRPQVELVASRYSQELKARDQTANLAMAMKSVNENNFVYNFHKIAQLWSSVFGEENLHLRTFEKNRLVEEDIRHDFLDLLKSGGVEIDSQKLRFDQGKANESLTALQGSAFAAINETIPFWNNSTDTGVNGENQRLKKAILNISSLSVGKYRAENPGEVQSRFEESNKKFFDKFLPGRSFELEMSSEWVNSMPLKEVEQVVRELTKTLLSEKVSSNGPALLDSDASYLRDIAIRILDKKPLSEKDAARLLELALRVRPEGPLIQKQLARAKREMGQK